MTSLRVAVVADLAAAAESLALAPAALAPVLLQPTARLLVGEAGRAALLYRQWADDGTADAVLARARGVAPGSTEVMRTASAWGCSRVRTEGGLPAMAVIGPPADAPLLDRFRHLAALAATRVEVAVALASGSGQERRKTDGSPALAADEAAHEAACAVLAELGLPVLSEERRDRTVADGEPWIVLDPLDGTGNFSAGFPPWAFSAALVQGGEPLAGLVVDLSSGRRWEGAAGSGAWRDGHAVTPRPGTTVVVPTGPRGRTVAVPSSARRVRVTGCTAVDLCLVADGSAAAWHDLDRPGTHVHDVAGGLAVLTAAGGVAVHPDGAPVRLPPDTESLIRLVAAADEPTAAALLHEFA